MTFGECLTQTRQHEALSLSMYTYAWFGVDARADVHTEVWTFSLCLTYTLGPCYVKSQIKAAVLLRAGERSEEEMQRHRKPTS